LAAIGPKRSRRLVAVVSVVGALSAAKSQKRIAHIKVINSPENANALSERLRDNLSLQPEPELADIYVVRSEKDLCSEMPPYVVSFLRSMF
jgi:hypothetical protein